MLHTHRRLIGPDEEAEHEPKWSLGRAWAVLIGSTVLVAVMAELLVGAVEHTATAWGMTHVFVGVVLVAIVGNAAEHSTAVLVAWRNQMDLALTIAIGSSLQIALFAAPVLVFVSYLFGTPMSLDFTPFEVVSVALAVAVVGLVAHDGRSHWMEGVMLLAVYLMLAVAFFFLPE
jgi:Ca2+:H+ antiporter